MKIKKTKILSAFIIVFFIASEPLLAASVVYESFIKTNASKMEFRELFEGGQSGSAIVSGDLNNDGVDDLIYSTPLASMGSRQWNGSVRIQFGRSAESISIFGANSNDQIGRAMAVGDYNNDGVDDLAIGAHEALVEGDKKGKVYIFYGRTGFGTENIDLDIQKADMEINGKYQDSAFGLTLHTTDVNNDELDDLLVGAPLASSGGNSGTVYGYFGDSKGLKNKNELTIYGEDPNERFSSAVTSGDFDRDGLTDFAVGAYYANTSDANQAGKVYVYLGRRTLQNIYSKPDLTLEGDFHGAWFGFSLAAGDINKDGYTDLGVSEFPFMAQRDLAKATIFYGGADLFEQEVLRATDENSDVNIKAAPEGLVLASKILFADVNDDETLDVILGAPGAETGKSDQAGDVFIINNPGALKANYYLNQGDYDSVIHGESSDDWFGYELSTLDYNNDQWTDLAIGAIYSENGTVYMLFGNGKKIGVEKSVNTVNGSEVSRGELVQKVVKKFEIERRKSAELENCRNFIDFCLFNFIAMSSYADIDLKGERILLYPDVQPGHKYYEAVKTGTMLGMVNGFMNEYNSPFRPELPVTRIQALKVILSAAELVPSKYRFELISELGSYEALQAQKSHFNDVDAAEDRMWWYPRYANFAYENELVDRSANFRPDEYITSAELNDLLERTSKLILE